MLRGNHREGSKASAFFEGLEGLELGDRLQIFWPSGGALHLDELRERQAPAPHAA